jgi:hypothetical protein
VHCRNALPTLIASLIICCDIPPHTLSITLLVPKTDNVNAVSASR